MNQGQEGQGETRYVTMVTGATGFVGPSIVLHLAEHGHRVVAFDLTPPSALVLRYWQPVQEHIVFEAGSVTDIDRLAQVAGRHVPTGIIDAAVITAVDPVTEAEQAARMVEVNFLGTLRLLEVARRPSVRRMLYISSGGVYAPGEPGRPITEDSPLHLAGGLYGITKEASERLCRRYRELFGIDIVVGRLGGPYGPMERSTGIRPILSPLYRLGRAALTEGTVRLRGGDRPVGASYTLDLAKAMRLLLEAPVLPHQMYNLASGQTQRLIEATDLLARLIPGARFEWVGEGEPADIDLGPVRHGRMDITRLVEDVGFTPEYDLERGLRTTLPWWREMVAAGG